MKAGLLAKQPSVLQVVVLLSAHLAEGIAAVYSALLVIERSSDNAVETLGIGSKLSSIALSLQRLLYAVSVSLHAESTYDDAESLQSGTIDYSQVLGT